MKLNHVGLNIQSEEEIVDFYQNVLGFHLEYQFDISTELGDRIFGVNEQVNVFLCKNKDILLELFVYYAHPKNSFSHICLDVTDREKIVFRCEERNYKVIRIDRADRADILFIKDKAGNVFELKNVE